MVLGIRCLSVKASSVLKLDAGGIMVGQRAPPSDLESSRPSLPKDPRALYPYPSRLIIPTNTDNTSLF